MEVYSKSLKQICDVHAQGNGNSRTRLNQLEIGQGGGNMCKIQKLYTKTWTKTNGFYTVYIYIYIYIYIYVCNVAYSHD